MTQTIDIETNIVEFFLQSSDFNGLPVSAILRGQADGKTVIAILEDLIRRGRITCVSSRTSVNPHIKRFPDLPSDQQVAQLEGALTDTICLYPSADLVGEHFNVNTFDDRPFSKKLLLGEPQLNWEGFDLGVLDRYYNDPRYLFHFGDHGGRLSILTEGAAGEILERDQVFLQTFGIGYDESDTRVAVVFLRYLSSLSPEHQQYWKSFIRTGKIKLHREYYRGAYLGEWPEYGSYFGAILTEIKLINELTTAIYAKALFRTVFGEDRPAELTPFLRPTLKNFNTFILEIDKLLSENINQDFFKDRIQLELETERPDGKIVVTQKGTLALLEEWLRTDITWDDEDEAIAVIVAPLKKLRRLRQRPAHKFETNKFSREYDDQQHEIVREVYVALRHLRMTLASHPGAPAIDVPRWIRDGKIAFA
jgi:hypothetical protein